MSLILKLLGMESKTEWVSHTEADSLGPYCPASVPTKGLS